MNLQELYLSRKKRFESTAKLLEAKYNRLSILRLLILVVGFSAVIYIFQNHAVWGLFSLIAFLVIAVKFIIWHQKLNKQKDHNLYLSAINTNELSAHSGNHSFFDGGIEFVDALHPYSFDLDLFGDHSLFQFCNRTVSAMGKSMLAKTLTTESSLDLILQRQEATKELAEQIDWRQNFQALGNGIEDDPKDIEELKKWLQEPSKIINNKFIAILRYIAPLCSFIALYLAFSQPLYIVILCLIPALVSLKITLDDINEIHKKINKLEKVLAKYSMLLKHIEAQNFNSPLLQEFKEKLKTQDHLSSKAIKKLSYIISQINVRYNFFAIFFNILGLWDIQWVISLERWKLKHQELAPAWLESIFNFDSIISLSTMVYNHPDWSYPKITTDAQLIGKSLGHPLIPRSELITNDLIMPTTAHIKLVTGSNMAGKSTFLRTVAINIVLALTGTKVCAKEFSLPLLSVYSSMRTTDALHENTSSFYAELKRLKIILDAIEDDRQVYFLLDEILKGTNSKDRHTGSKALIEQLIKSGGAGIIATHDLELSSLETKYNGNLENLCMEVEVKGDELEFDYKIKKGVSKSFNATTLMRNMGIRISEELM